MGENTADGTGKGTALPEPEYRIDPRTLREIPLDPGSAEAWLATTAGDGRPASARIAWLRILGRLPEAEAAAREALNAVTPAFLHAGALHSGARIGAGMLSAGVRPAIRLAQVLQWKGQLSDALRLLAAVDRFLAAPGHGKPGDALVSRAFLHQHRGKVLLDAGHPVWALTEFRRALHLRIAAGAPGDQLQSAEMAVSEALRRLK